LITLRELKEDFFLEMNKEPRFLLQKNSIGQATKLPKTSNQLPNVNVILQNPKERGVYDPEFDVLKIPKNLESLINLELKTNRSKDYLLNYYSILGQSYYAPLKRLKPDYLIKPLSRELSFELIKHKFKHLNIIRQDVRIVDILILLKISKEQKIGLLKRLTIMTDPISLLKHLAKKAKIDYKTLKKILLK